mmetsp:Transcript_1689/g.3956  ORF Transcript_1689/g.3956 Transcript_1689/m.3956 type:complete len:167 (-) Transcript_1689:11-511(-)
MEADSFRGQTALLTKAPYRRNIFTAWAFTGGVMAEATMVSGARIGCMEEVSTDGPMAAPTRASTHSTKRMASARSDGQMAEDVMGTGERVSSMEEERIARPVDMSEAANGRMAEGYDGSTPESGAAASLARDASAEFLRRQSPSSHREEQSRERLPLTRQAPPPTE